jgi:5-methyltetrahydropteroyltriglutamate--homocysteine methyltransferase
MASGKRPFRADHVGSLLRPKALLQARDRRDKGEIGEAWLREVEDESINEVVAFQEVRMATSILPPRRSR